MIYIVVDKLTNRLAYIVEILFSQIWGVDYQLLPKDRLPDIASENAVYVYYGRHLSDDQDLIHIPLENNLLFEESIGQLEPEIQIRDNIPYLFSSNGEGKENRLTFDLFSACFYVLVEYDAYTQTTFDSYNRYDEASLFSVKSKLYEYPLLPIYLERLEELIVKEHPKFQIKTKSFDYEVTIDIDRPWKYLYKSPFVNLAGLGKVIYQRDFHEVKERLDVLLKRKKDPYETYDVLLNLAPKEKLLFFF